MCALVKRQIHWEGICSAPPALLPPGQLPKPPNNPATPHYGQQEGEGRVGGKPGQGPQVALVHAVGTIVQGPVPPGTSPPNQQVCVSACAAVGEGCHSVHVQVR